MEDIDKDYFGTFGSINEYKMLRVLTENIFLLNINDKKR